MNGPGREAFAAELLQLARCLHHGGTDPFDILLRLGRENARAGLVLPEVVSVVRLLPGLGEWDHRAAYARRWKDAPVSPPGEGLDDGVDVPWD